MTIHKKRRVITAVLLAIGLLVLAGAIIYTMRPRYAYAPVTVTPKQPSSTTPVAANKEAPTLSVEKVISGLDHPWDITFLPGNAMLAAERDGTISSISSGNKQIVFSVPGVAAKGEAGLMGMVADIDYAKNNYVFTCYASATDNDVRLVRWKYDGKSFTDKTAIVTGMPLNATGRHSGCRPRMDTAGTLWVGTGDAAIGTNPQAPGSLGGKILRIDRNGKALEGNLKLPFDTRIYSYGHRNVQGIALFAKPVNGVAGLSVEHGSTKDDEVNKLVSGNAGWNPVPGYNEAVAMTDTTLYPDALVPVWTSGDPTIAPSGATILTGQQWKGWEGRMAMAVLKAKELRIQAYDESQKLLSDDVFFEGQFGRLRSAVQGGDGNLYLTTDNGGDDAIIKVTPK